MPLGSRTPSAPRLLRKDEPGASRQTPLSMDQHDHRHHHHHQQQQLQEPQPDGGRPMAMGGVPRTASSRFVGLGDHRLVEMAAETSTRIQWERILRTADVGPARWKWQENVGRFAIYTKHESQRFAVLAIGTVPCSLPELVRVLEATTDDDFAQKMEALYGDDFRGGAVVHHVDAGARREVPTIEGKTDAALSHLSVKTATFQRAKWLGSHEEWCHLDAVFHHHHHHHAPGGDHGPPQYEKLTATIRPKDIFAPKLTPGRTKYLHDVITGYGLHPEEPDAAATVNGGNGNGNGNGPPVVATRVHFYAELFTPRHFGFAMPTARTAASDKAIRHRLVRMAHACERLETLVRRRRLGVQILIDGNRFLPPTNCRCVACDRMLLLAKLCRLCGFGVCEDCSSKHERERQVRGFTRRRVERVRVCDPCLARIDGADYAHLNAQSLEGPTVRPDPVHAKPAGAVLTELLQDALLSAPRDKKAQVLNVIKAVLDQDLDDAASSSSAGSPRSVLLTPRESEVGAALSKFELETLPLDAAELANPEGRGYAIDTRKPDGDYPLPENEAARLEAIQASNVRNLGQSEELNIICSLAAKEMGCFASMVTIVDKDELFVAASNVSSLEHQTFSRNDAFCAHTIMDDKPLVIPHPEADVRFHRSAAVNSMGIKYYCGFPLVAEDNTVIGAVCCLDQQTREMSASQYTALKKLAQTASKVVKVQGEQRRKLSNALPPLPTTSAAAAASSS